MSARHDDALVPLQHLRSSRGLALIWRSVPQMQASVSKADRCAKGGVRWESESCAMLIGDGGIAGKGPEA